MNVRSHVGDRPDVDHDDIVDLRELLLVKTTLRHLQKPEKIQQDVNNRSFQPLLVSGSHACSIFHGFVILISFQYLYNLHVIQACHLDIFMKTQGEKN